MTMFAPPAMAPRQLDARSLGRLQEIHPDLSRVVLRAAEISQIEFVVTEGLRTLDRQKKLYEAGASKTMRSRHLDGHAVDLAARVGGEIRWDWPLYDKLAAAMKNAAAILGVEIEWGGDWVSFRDGPHFQLTWKGHP